MPSKTHDNIVNLLTHLCNNYRYGGKVYYTEIVSSLVTQKPLVLIILRKGGSLTREYYPDLYAIGGKDVKLMFLKFGIRKLKIRR